MSDNEDYNKFCTQYIRALKRWNYAESATKPADNGFWFGKLTSFPYIIDRIEDPTGQRRTGLEFWEELRIGNITIIDYKDLAVGTYVNTTQTGEIFQTAEVTMTVTIIYEINGTRDEQKFEIKHNLKQTWYATDSEFDIITK
ncbi:MAG TPA: hypothetical protein PKE69_07640 [Pyrinomonadaceae bacterium]|nr:hypothetical protein [Pyrinomonadaceae bacterium]